MRDNDYEVLVVGAGPVGLALAGELALRGVRTLVIERLTEQSSTIKAGGINLVTAEAAYRRGLLPAMQAVHDQAMAVMTKFATGAGRNVGALPVAPGKALKPRGHFAGIWILDSGQLDPNDPELAATPASGTFMVSQQAVESIFGGWAEEHGAQLRRGVELVGLVDEGDDGVTVELADGQRITADWLVGCDGGRSNVRKLAGFDFPGTEPTITGHQAIVDIEGADRLPLGWNRTPRGMLVYGPVPGRILTVEYDGPPTDRETPITIEELETSLRTVSGVDEVRITGIHSATRFTDHARQVSEYRRGRVFLAGDAAHVHSPFGGQGLNLGVGDAVNLGWKLAATIKGTAPDGLLDTYTTERHPVGAWVLDWNRAQVALMRPDVQTGALRGVISDLIGTGDGVTYFVKKLAGLWINYDFGGDHPLVGKRTPDLVFEDGSRLGEYCADGRPVLVDLGDGSLAEVAAGWGERINVLTKACPEHPELGGLLVRPDGYVAWAAEAGSEGLDSSLARWFGSRVTMGV
ncbi:MAG TPA: FAD-dependent oxidoreductase [Pseudonocardiaceae bacterium]|nr:FAD-dependent oxidoreductase [Pseudonocardiaceae bacterium]